MSELEFVTNVFDEVDLDYWLDGGTLLGLVRDGSLLSHDPDIDISIWSTELHKLDSLIELMNQEGYVAQQKSYRGLVFQCDFQPENGRKVNIHVFRKHQDYAWCPAGKMTFSAPTDGFQTYLYGIPRHGLHLLNNWRNMIPVDKFPYSHFYDVKTFWIPVMMIKPKEYFETSNAYYPKKYEAYLEYRYGDWETPVTEWDYWQDDHALRPTQPSKIIGDTFNSE